MSEALYQVMPDLTSEEYEELKADIAVRGVMVPIEYDEYGNVLDGHHRLRICKELGITEYPVVIRSGMTEEQKRTHARKLNMARRQLNREQKQELIRQQLRETPEKSDRQIAAGLGVTNKTVGAQRRDMESTEEIPQFETSIGADGKERPRQTNRQTVQAEEPDEHRPHVTNNSGNNEWYTPAKYIEMAREVLGQINTDPASCEYANQTVKAETYYSIENSGLDKPWHGKVWMNPPYAADLVQKFADKLIAEFRTGNVDEAIVLVNNATETNWFNTMISEASAVAFPKGRIRYESITHEMNTPLQGQAFIYLGYHPYEFTKTFKAIGWTAVIE